MCDIMKRKHYLFVTILIGFFLAACIGFQKPIHAAVITIPMIKELPTLNVAYQTDQPPLSYQNEKGEFAGIVRDVLDRIAQLTGLTFHYIKIPSGVVSNSFYEKNEITLIASVLYNNANRERQELRLTIPYLDMDQVILTPIDFDSNHLTDLILASDRHSDVFWEEHNDNTSPKIQIGRAHV